MLRQKTLACAPHSKAGKDGAGREALVTLQHMYKAAMTSASEGMQGGTGSLVSLTTFSPVRSPCPPSLFTQPAMTSALRLQHLWLIVLVAQASSSMCLGWVNGLWFRTSWSLGTV